MKNTTKVCTQELMEPNKVKIPCGDLFLELLRRGLWHDYKCCDERFCATEQQWEQIMQIGKQQSVNGILFDAIERLEREDMPSLKLRMNMAAGVNAIEQGNIKICKALVKIATIFDKNKIEYLLLKGQAAGDCYPISEHRVGGDIDIFIDHKDRQLAYTLLFEKEIKSTTYLRHDSGILDGVMVEMHRALAHMRLPLYVEFDRQLLSDKVRLPLEMIEVEGRKINCPSATFHAIFMVEHMASHLITGLGFRQLCDWARLLYHHRNKIDRATCSQIINEAKLNHIANIFTIICIDYLGLDALYAISPPIRNTQINKDVAKVLNIIFGGGNFGKHYSTLQSSASHAQLPLLLRKPVGLLIILRNYSKYELLAPGLMRRMLWQRTKHFLKI